MTPINIIIDNKTVIDDVIQCDIDQAEGQYCSSVSLSLKSKSFWALCDPTTNFGALRIKVVIGVTTYQFLVEERDTTPSRAGVAFTVWGRSKQALLSKPYSKTINDTDDTSHPWQTGNTTASAIVAYVVSNYCPYSVTVNWNAGDFAVYADSFSVSNQSPIDVISSLAGVIGAELVAAADGSLSIEEYSVDEGASVESYNDLDDITQLSENIDYPSGYNAVTVYGYGAGGSNAYISAEYSRLTDLPYAGSASDIGSNIFISRPHIVRVYYYHPEDIDILYSACSQHVSVAPHSCGEEQFTEDIQLIWGKGSRGKPNTKGALEITGDVDEPIACTTDTYSTNYCDFNVVCSAIGEFTIMFYFADKSVYTVYSFSVVANEEGAGSACSSVVVERISTDIVVPGTPVRVRVFGLKASSAYCSAGSPALVKTSESSEDEDVIFSNGVATLAYPVKGWDNFTPWAYGFHQIRPSLTPNSNQLTMSLWIGSAEYFSVSANIKYRTAYTEYQVDIPGSWLSTSFEVWFTFSGCTEMKKLSIPVSVGGSKDVALNVSNWASGVNISEVDVEVDGDWAGQTDIDGNINLTGVSVGDHAVKLTKDGYLQSDLDDIENSTFTVE